MTVVYSSCTAIIKCTWSLCWYQLHHYSGGPATTSALLLHNILHRYGSPSMCTRPSKHIMQAAVISKTGGPEVLEYVSDYPVPSRKPGKVLVKLHSSSVNPVDTAVRSGFLKPAKYPKVLGGDLAGIVVEAGAGSKFKEGDHVAALTNGYYNELDGTYCQYVAVEESELAKLPDSTPLATAGGLPLVGLTAWQSLMYAKPIEGQRCLVFAASGGVGHVAVQCAKALGLYVVGVAGPQNVDWVKNELGADEVVDYHAQDFADLYSSPDKQFDIIMDPLSITPERISKLLSVLQPKGHYSHILNKGTDHDALEQLKKDAEKGQGPSISITYVQPNGAQLEQLYALWDAGKLKLEVAKVFELKDVAEAHKQVETGHTRGKCVLSIPQ